ncbi:MAG: FAD-dependent oxidoreductase [Patescibacteria group bacterium UBA2163]
MNQEFDSPISIYFEKRVHEYEDVFSYYFSVADDFTFKAGQNVRVVVPQLEGDAARRSLSIASSPTESLLQFTLHVGSHSAYKKAFMNLQTGDELHVVKLKGKTILPEDDSCPIVCIAGGIGIVPFRSILMSLHEKGQAHRASLVHVSSHEYLYEDELSPLLTQQYRITRPEIETTVTEVLKDKPSALYYVAGPPTFIDSLVALLTQHGINEENILFSRFTGYEDRFDS